MDLIEVDLKKKYTNENRHPYEIARFNVINSLIKRINLDCFNNESTIIDIGCGDLFFIEKIYSTKYNFDYIGIDNALDNSQLTSLNENYTNSTMSIRVFNNTDEAFNAVKKPVSIILLLDVIEHIENDILFLKSIRQNPFISENTFFVVTVPSFNSLFSSHDVFIKHYRRYNNKELVNTLNNSGYQIVNKGYYFSSLLLIRIFEIFKEKILKIPTKNEGIGKWNGNRTISNIIQITLSIDFKILNTLKAFIRLPGLSNYAICKKSV